MYIDVNKCIVMEQNAWPGSIGDSSAESARMLHLQMQLGDYVLNIDLNQFVTPLGYIRHPTAPADWREKDFSNDQALPLYLAFSMYDPARTTEMEKRIKAKGYRVGNGDLVSPGFFGALKQSKLLVSIATVGQALFFKLPFRWSESKKKFERTTDNSGDYLNYIHLGLHGYKLARKMISKEVLKQKVRDYYRPPLNPERHEPNSDRIIELYDQVIDKHF